MLHRAAAPGTWRRRPRSWRCQHDPLPHGQRMPAADGTRTHALPAPVPYSLLTPLKEVKRKTQSFGTFSATDSRHRGAAALLSARARGRDRSRGPEAVWPPARGSLRRGPRTEPSGRAGAAADGHESSALRRPPQDYSEQRPREGRTLWPPGAPGEHACAVRP